jgi:hypothetical protein
VVLGRIVLGERHLPINCHHKVVVTTTLVLLFFLGRKEGPSPSFTTSLSLPWGVFKVAATASSPSTWLVAMSRSS